jgi:predicted PurR-regulated permease PerM
MSRQVIGRRYLPAQLPIFQTLTAWLFLDRIHASGWVYGVIGTLLAVVWIACIYALATHEYRHPAEIKRP